MSDGLYRDNRNGKTTHEIIENLTCIITLNVQKLLYDCFYKLLLKQATVKKKCRYA